MQGAGRSTPLLLVGGTAFFIDMFLHWTRAKGAFPFSGTVNGWQIQLVSQAGLLALALALVEFTRLGAVWLTRTSALLGCLLGAATAILIIGGLINMHWGNLANLKFSSYGYAAWIALGIAVVLLYGAWLRLGELRRVALADG